MMQPRLTQTGLTKPRGRPTNGAMKKAVKRMLVLGVAAAAALPGGCVSVTAPDKPIVINLNINITQQVVYRLDGQAKELIQGNPNIF